MACVECLPADKPWDVVSVTRRRSGVAPRACVRVYARVLVPPNLYIHTYIQNSRMLGLTLDVRCRARTIQRSAPQRSPVADSDTDP